MDKVKGHSCARRYVALKTMGLTGGGGETRKLRMEEQTRGLGPAPSLVLIAELVLAGCLLGDGL